MNIYEFGPIAAALDGASSVMQSLIDLVAPLAGANAAALAVVVLTMLVRATLVPVGVSQARAQRTRRRLAPRIAELRRRHGRDPERLQRETMALYAAEKASPLAGCLPLLLQAPVLSLVYGLFVLPTIGGSANVLFGETLAGAPLGSSFVTAVHGGGVAGLLVGGVLLAVLTVVVLLSRRSAVRWAAIDAIGSSGGPGARAGGGAAGSGRGGGAGGGGGGVPDVPAAFAPDGRLARALTWLPLVTVVVAAFVPLAATIYLTTSAAWTLAERTVLGAFIH